MPSTSKREWQQKALEPTLKKFPPRQERFEASSDIEVDTLYTPEDIADLDYGQDLGYPGEFPFTRGVQPNMYRGRLWTMRQYSGFASAEETNRRFHYLLEHGETGLSIAFDLPTQIGYDSDHPLCRGEVGKVGVPINTLKDMEVLFQGIPLNQVTTSMTINSTAPILLAMYMALAKRQGADLAKLGGTIQNDVLKEYIARGTYIFPPKPSLRLVCDIFQFCSQHLPSFNTISVSGYHMREAGATAAQELAFTLANGIAYAQAAVDAGLPVDSFGPRLSFFFASHNNFFEEVAKFRAARPLWAHIMKERFEAKDPRSWMLRFHTQTAGVTLTAQQPENNVIRVTVQALAAVLGGTQSLHTNSRDEALALPSENSVNIALRTQQILAHESEVGNTVDPLGGSYFIESLTKQLTAKATAYIKEIDRRGGAVAAIEQGYPQREVQESAYRFQKEVDSKQRLIVGVNSFVTEYPPIPGLLRVSPEEERRVKARLAQTKAERDPAKVQAALKRLEAAARGTDNAMPAILECVEAYATLGEVCDVLRGVFGTQKEFLVF